MDGLPATLVGLTISAVLGITTISVITELGGNWFAFDLVGLLALFVALVVMMQFAKLLLRRTSRFGERLR